MADERTTQESSPAWSDSDSAAPPVIAAKKRRLPPFLDHFNGRDLKIFFRCWVAVWVACLLIFILPSLESIGTATFFAALVLLFLPPSGIVFVYLLGALSLFIGICLAWAWGVITMKAAQAARPAADTQAKMAALQQTAVSQAQNSTYSATEIAQRLVYEGYMLDARVTTVTFCLICTFVYFMARLRASNPKAALTAIFGIIISDLFLNYTPLLPSFSGTLPLTLVKPAAIGVGLGLACSILFFPQSTSHVVLDSMEDIVRLLQVPLAMTANTLCKKDEQPNPDDLRMTQAGIIQKYKSMEPSLAFLPLDFSVGCWGAEDVASFQGPLRDILVAILSLLDFHIGRIVGEARTQDVLRKYVDKTPDGDEKPTREVGAHQLTQLAQLLDGFRSPDSHPLRKEVIQELVKTSTTAIDACAEGLSVVQECIHLVNCRRWFRRPSQAEREQLQQRCEKALENLAKARSVFINEMSDILIGQHDQRTLDGPQHFRPLMFVLVFEEHISNTVQKTEALLARVSTVFQESTKIRVYLPTRFRYAASWASSNEVKAPGSQGTEDDPDRISADDATKAAQEKLRATRGFRTKPRPPLSRAILGTYHWFTCDEGLYAMRMVVVTIALGIPGVIPHSAGFYYREKGLWALIMGQTGLLVYMADFTFSVIARVIGTVIGGVLGLLAWYIGSANGPGNPYGLSAITAAILVILVWTRLYLPPALMQGGIIGGATFLLVIAYSYDDTHIPQYGNPGVGYNVFWRRLLLVLVGVAASAILQTLPRPPSASRHVCKTLSRAMRTLSTHYALLLTVWAQNSTEGKRLAEPLSLQLAETLVSLDGPIKLLGFEFSSSRFDSASLAKVNSLCRSLNRQLGRLLLLSSSLPQEFQEQLARQTGLLDHRLIGQVMAVMGLCEQALKTGDALPEILPTPLFKQAVDNWSRGRRGQEEQVISAEMMRDEGYRRFCVAASAYFGFLITVDEMVLVVKGVLGEAHLVGGGGDREGRWLLGDDVEV
ncbi:hypothetical protein CBS76997_5878 [Aspergillus niger]|nr:hypothetical protein CBS12448_1300 [Aspergillus niger]KAI2895676.1 hypothetical protein CBS13152_3744 [Aspergillus niger]KAI2976685.1 hypothetical protein CBS147324_2429 [Aspergillus niger]KAI3042897.1 hypothetical protein CBS76997_5878 [Aspergillus niger]GJP90533.1 protein tyrosine phosphatase-like protein, PTPLA family protein [Aspergillus niger]